MSENDVLFGYRLQLLGHAARTSVSEACRAFGVHRSTFYRWKRLVDRHGLEVLRPRSDEGPGCRTSCRRWSGCGSSPSRSPTPARPAPIASELGREKWGEIVVLGNGVGRCLRRHGLNTPAYRLSLIAGYRAPYEPPREPEPEPHIEVERPASRSASNNASSSAASRGRMAPSGS